MLVTCPYYWCRACVDIPSRNAKTDESLAAFANAVRIYQEKVNTIEDAQFPILVQMIVTCPLNRNNAQIQAAPRNAQTKTIPIDQVVVWITRVGRILIINLGCPLLVRMKVAIPDDGFSTLLCASTSYAEAEMIPVRTQVIRYHVPYLVK